MKLYKGLRTAKGNLIFAIHPQGWELLSLRLDLASLSPEGFDWGESNEGAAQLAVALLADVVGDEAALTYYRDFEEQFVQQLPSPSWQRSIEVIREWFYHTDRVAENEHLDPSVYGDTGWEFDAFRFGLHQDRDFMSLAI